MAANGFSWYDRQLQSRRIRRREKLSLAVKEYVAFMFTLKQFSPTYPAQSTQKHDIGVATPLLLMADVSKPFSPSF